MFGQLEAFACIDLPEAICIPFLGKVTKDSHNSETDRRDGYEVGLSGRGCSCALSPSLQTASSVVNCAFGPDCSHQNKTQRSGHQNARLAALHDPSGFPHTFWKLTKSVKKGDTIWGDYGDAYWEEYAAGADVERPQLCSILRSFREPMRGFLCDLPVDLSDDNS